MRAMIFGLICLLPLFCPSLSDAQKTKSATKSKTKKYPNFEHAFLEAPQWLKKNAPFDMATFIKPPKPDKNAATLYLPAFFEFYPSVANCLRKTPSEEEILNIKKRTDRIGTFYHQLVEEKKHISVEKLDELLADLQTGFQKIEQAQKRKQCLFTTDLDFSAALPQMDAAGRVISAYDLKILREVEQGKLSAAIDDLKICLRMIRDLRRRGFITTQYICNRLERVVLKYSLQRILASPAIEQSHCDKLQAILIEHRRNTVDAFEEGVKTEYATVRIAIHDIHKNPRELVHKWTGENPSNPYPLLVKTLIQYGFEPPGVDLKKGPVKAAFSLKLFELSLYMLNDESYRKEVNYANKSYHAMRKGNRMNFPDRKKFFVKQRKEIEKNTIVCSMFAFFNVNFYEAVRFHRSHRRAAICLVALKRFQLSGKTVTEKTKLSEILSAAKVKETLLDPYSHKPFRLRVVGGQPVIYSIGPNKTDEHALKESSFETERKIFEGDIVYRLHRKIE